MANKTESEEENGLDGEPTEVELASRALMVELLRSGRILTYISDILVEWVDESKHPGEPVEAVVTRHICGLVVPNLAGDEVAGVLWKTAGLIESVRDLIVADFQLQLDGGERLI